MRDKVAVGPLLLVGTTLLLHDGVHVVAPEDVVEADVPKDQLGQVLLLGEGLVDVAELELGLLALDGDLDEVALLPLLSSSSFPVLSSRFLPRVLTSWFSEWILSSSWATLASSSAIFLLVVSEMWASLSSTFFLSIDNPSR